jgi:hypothetical protein
LRERRERREREERERNQAEREKDGASKSAGKCQNNRENSGTMFA